MTATRLFSESAVESALSITDALGVVERTYIELNRGKVVNPAKLSMHMGDDGKWPDRNAFAISMPAYVDWLDAVGTKWAVAAWDADTDEPISSLILLFDISKGQFTAVMEGMYLTGIRTALQSAVGLKYLLESPPESIGVFGAGFQARFQLAVIDEIFDINNFYIYDKNPERASELTSQIASTLNAEVTTCATPQAAAKGDAVITVTDSKEPVLEDTWVKETDLIIALGSYRELPDKTILGANTLVVDHIEQCLNRGALSEMVKRGELSAEDVDTTIGAILDEYNENWARNAGRTVFVPIGLGALDIAIADGILKNNKYNTNYEFKFS